MMATTKQPSTTKAASKATLAKPYQPYPKYKDSGVAWLGEIPKGWEVKKIKYACLLKNTKVEAKKSQAPYVGLENIQSWTGKYIKTVSNTSESITNSFSKEDILFNKLRPYLAKAWKADFCGICSSECSVLKAIEMHPKFYLYYFLNTDFISEVNSSTYGSKMPRANWEFIGEAPIVSIKREQSLKIANFLDHETVKIDQLISKQQRLIELLQEKRQALISHAVTKGLDPNAKMKDSEVAWLGEIPEGWRVVKLSYALKLISGDFISASEIKSENQYPVFGGNGLRGYCSKYNCSGEYVLIGRQGALCGNINIASGQFYATEHAVVTYPHVKFNITFLASFLHFMNLGQYSVSAAQPGLSVERINDLKICIPPYIEQNKIGDYLDTQTAKIDQLIDKAEQAIDLLQERRTALISAAVTGKIDVRGWQAPSAAQAQVLESMEVCA
jgi:type I restriction enzyme S subunit